MPAPHEMLDLYLSLAEVSEEQKRPQQRERFLALATAAAYAAGEETCAEACRTAIVSANPGHTFHSFSSAAEAMESPEVAEYLHSLGRLYPFEKAEFLLQQFRRSVGRTRKASGRDSDLDFSSENAFSGKKPRRSRKRRRSAEDLPSLEDMKPLPSGLEWLRELQSPQSTGISQGVCALIAGASFALGVTVATLLHLLVR